MCNQKSDLNVLRESKENWAQLRADMESCYQFENVNMIQHGEMVHDWYCDIKGSRKYEWDFGSVENLINKVVDKALDPVYIRSYHVFHDCGKPYCRTVDEQGRQHFPNHARISYDTWLEHGGSEEIGWYILNDMAFHTLKGEDIDPILKDPRAPTLLLTAWAELHANAQMFGGIQSTSFKIKRKFLEKNTKRFINSM